VTKKKKRKRPAPPRAARDTTAVAPSTGRSTRDRRAAGPPQTPAERRAARLARAQQAQAAWVHPPVGPSVAWGLKAVGASPALLGLAFGSVLAVWLLYQAYGVSLAAFPQFLMMSVSLLPLHSIVDVLFLPAAGRISTVLAFTIGTALIVVRATMEAVGLAMLLEVIGWRKEASDDAGVDGPARSLRNRLLRRALYSFPTLITLEIGSFVLALVGWGFTRYLGNLGVVVLLAGGLYYLVFAPVIAAVEEVGPRDAIRLSYRAARARGPRHMQMTFSYLAVTLLITFTTPPSRVSEATPSLLIWAFVLLMSFIHVAALGSFTYRWRIVREPVLEAAANPQPRRARRGRRG
jgi:hypothetical protein